MKIEVIKEPGRNFEGEQTEYSIYGTVWEYRNLYSMHPTIEEADATKKWLLEGQNTPEPVKTFFDKKFSGLSEVSVKILLNQLNKREDLKVYNLVVKPYSNTGKFYIKAILK